MKYSLLLSLLIPFQAMVFAQEPTEQVLFRRNSAPPVPDKSFIAKTSSLKDFSMSPDQKLANLVLNRKTMSLFEFQKQVGILAQTGNGFTRDGINLALAELHGKTNTPKFSKSFDSGIGKASFAEAILLNAPGHQLDQRAVTSLQKGTKWQNTKTVLKGAATAGIALGIGAVTGPVGTVIGLGGAGAAIWNAKRKFVPKSDKSKIDGLFKSHGGDKFKTGSVSFPEQLRAGLYTGFKKFGQKLRPIRAGK
jgi:hypothetical protein